ncbi:CocE/NonD family hydrolase [Paralimibaculum aggregatum]|uniref:CocE/NonD family hydrolase n=1 Tax=Paralimibaculum aggregatum TaxID=3036245 RepID=A0ABQ6LR71_9RHOB|nr:CocE/NonD family hydrolase [Limibaculum sp. NKW23]GMG83729.1 CocE/NonD family hydrolase [Limibaculum sp. NKW23]
MGDDPRGSAAWGCDPCRYLDGRPAEAGRAAPVSRYLEMRDGVRLALDIHLPDPAPGPVPAVVIFTPYYRRFRLAPGSSAEPSPNIAAYRDIFVPRGYALVAVDVRGTGASFGSRDSFRSPAERADYAEVVDWIARQPWCDGRLGATGISYLGAAADFAAASGHPALKAIAPISAVWDSFRDHFYPGGLRLTDLIDGYAAICDALDRDRRAALRRYAYFADPSLEGPAPVDEDPDGALLAAAIAAHDANAQMQDFLREFQFRDDGLAHDPGFTPDSFSPHAAAPEMRADLAVLSISGWMDGAYAGGAISRFLSTPCAEKRLLIGPWDHGARVNASPFRAQETPEFPVLGEVLRFFDTHVAGRETGLAAEAPVHLHVMGAERWEAAAAWPPHRQTRVLHLAEGALEETPGPAGTLSHRVDPAQTTGLGTRWGRLQIRDVRTFYPDWEDRRDTDLAFRSAPLAEAATLLGHAVLDLVLASEAPDASLFAYLEDIAPDGRRRYVTEGMLRALHGGEDDSPTYRATWPLPSFRRADAAPLPAGRQVRRRIAFLPTGWEFRQGHRIGLRIAGTDRDNFTIWPYGGSGGFELATGAAGCTLSLPLL